MVEVDEEAHDVSINANYTRKPRSTTDRIYLFSLISVPFGRQVGTEIQPIEGREVTSSSMHICGSKLKQRLNDGAISKGISFARHEHSGIRTRLMMLNQIDRGAWKILHI